MKLDKKDLSYAIQGFGSVGLSFSATATGMLPTLQLIAASDSSGGISSGFGLDASVLATYKKGGGRLHGFAGEDNVVITNDQLLAEEVDILVLAALGDVITEQNADRVPAKIILELANGPVSDAAYDMLTKRGVIVIPDILANAGGVIVSYLEWLQNLSGEQWEESKLNNELEEYIVSATTQALTYADKHKLSLKEAALAVAMQRLLSARNATMDSPQVKG